MDVSTELKPLLDPPTAEVLVPSPWRGNGAISPDRAHARGWRLRRLDDGLRTVVTGSFPGKPRPRMKRFLDPLHEIDESLTHNRCRNALPSAPPGISFLAVSSWDITTSVDASRIFSIRPRELGAYSFLSLGKRQSSQNATASQCPSFGRSALGRRPPEHSHAERENEFKWP